MQHSQSGARATIWASSLGIGWGHSARIGYVFLLAFVFPFICWGRMGQPGHPHPGPHFVFSPPPGMAAMTEQMAPPSAVDHRGHLASSTPVSNPSEATGQSIPDTLSSLFLLLLTAAGLWLLYLPTGGRILVARTLGSAQYVSGLPLPPPRLA